MIYLYQQGVYLVFQDRDKQKRRQLLEGLTRARLITPTQCLGGKDQFIFGFCSTKKYTFLGEEDSHSFQPSRMPHTCQTNHNNKASPKHKIWMLHYNIFIIISQQDLSIKFLLVLNPFKYISQSISLKYFSFFPYMCIKIISILK